MVYSSVPVYLDPPNWQQQLNASNHGQGTSENVPHHLGQLQPAQSPPSLPPHGGGVGSGSTRPCSMVDRARLAMIPQPEAALKCPRCESTNTKFCYFNNYNLSQPRHFCKTCRRYWTRGGTLRNVPVGGGCRRNKKSKSNRSKSPALTDGSRAGNSSSTSSIPSSCSLEMINNFSPQPPQLPFMASSQNFTRYGSGTNIGSDFNEINISAQNDTGFQIIGSNSQQIPFLGGFDSQTGLYPYQNDQGVDHASKMAGENTSFRNMSSNSRVFQFPPVKIEDNRGLNLQIPISMGGNFSDNINNQMIWGGNSWSTDLSGLSSSSTSHLL